MKYRVELTREVRDLLCATVEVDAPSAFEAERIATERALEEGLFKFHSIVCEGEIEAEVQLAVPPP